MKKELKEKLDFYGIQYEINQTKKKLQKTINKNNESKYLWIIRNLSTYRNCFVNEDTFSVLDFDIIKEILKVDKINYRPSTSNEDGVAYLKAGYVIYI